MVYRCFTEKREGFDVEARAVLKDLRDNLGMKSLRSLRLFSRYDVEGISRDVFETAKTVVFSEPQCDNCYDEELPEPQGEHWNLIVEPLPGQYDQRSDSCAQCIQMLTCAERPAVAAARVFSLFGSISEADKEKISAYLINPVESRKAGHEKPDTLLRSYPKPAPVKAIEGLISADDASLFEILSSFGLAMDMDDLKFTQKYFRDTERRDPTVTELRVIDTYWSDHCRHTTFGTVIDEVTIEDPDIAAAYERYLSARREVYGENTDNRAMTLMDIATIGTKTLRHRGGLKNLDVSPEVNACSIHVEAKIKDSVEDWLLMFKNETHNHPTEIEPFGGAATCIGGAIRDPLSGRSYVYQAMRVTGSGDPTVPISETIPGKLPQRKLTTTAAAGYSSYGNQIGLATGLVREIYHPGYVAKRMEVGAVVGAVRADNVVRLEPEPGDVVILLGGRTGRDGIGGATGSSKVHGMESLTESASEVQKGNAPEERKIKRLFRKPEVTKLIKRCNDFGAGGVSVAIGELADGLKINLSKITKKYEGLDGTELAISESQERMAVVVAPEDADLFIREAEIENLEATVVAEVSSQPRMIMQHDGQTILDLSREFLSSNGAPKHTKVSVSKQPGFSEETQADTLKDMLKNLAKDLNFCSQRGLIERFDASIGAGSVLMPLGGKYQLTPAQSMAAMLPVLEDGCETCSVMSFGFDPYLSSKNPYLGAKAAVVTSIAKLVASGCSPDDVYLSLQEYFEKLRGEPDRWGKPFSALLGALDAQLGLGVAAIGGKDSMSGTFLDLDVPPTLISFAIAPCDARTVISPEFKYPGKSVCLFMLGNTLEETKNVWSRIYELINAGEITSAWALEEGGVLGGIMKMSLGNGIGFTGSSSIAQADLALKIPGGIIAECEHPIPDTLLLGTTTQESVITACGESVALSEILPVWEDTLEDVFSVNAEAKGDVTAISYDKRPTHAPALKIARPRAVIPVFPGTNCEYDTARALEIAGAAPEIVVIKNLNPEALEQSVLGLEKAIRESQMIVIPGGFSGGDEPDGSGKFIATFFRNPRITDAVHELLRTRDGLILGICNGFQALIKLGLVPFGEIVPMTDECPTLTYNLIGRHQSRYVTTRIASMKSPWLSRCSVGDLHTIPVSHGEGRFIASEDLLDKLIKNGQIATQYADLGGVPSMDISVNPNGSVCAVEGILSPDGRVFGKMGHTERKGLFVCKNIPGNKHQPIFESGVDYYK